MRPAGYNAKMPTRIVTFDAGQTLIELDLDFLAARVATRGITVPPSALAAAEPAAWQRYDELDAAGGLDHPQLWRELMTALLAGAGARAADARAAAGWLFDQQPHANLFRRPIAGMVELARELAAGGARVAVLSNSEGRLAELLAEIGVRDAFDCVIDSGAVGVAKPDRRIFELAIEALGVRADCACVHVGDSWSADIAGALGAGWRAVWFGRHARATGDARIAHARDAAGVRAAIDHFFAA